MGVEDTFDAMVMELSKDYVSPQALDLKMKKRDIQDELYKLSI